MTIKLNEKQLKGIVANCVKRVLSEDGDAARRAEIDAAWDEFENSKPYSARYPNIVDYEYGNRNVEDEHPWNLLGLNAQEPYIHNDASNSADTYKNNSRQYARMHAGNKDTPSIRGLGGEIEGDYAVNTTDFGDSTEMFNDRGGAVTRGKYYGFPNYSQMDESVRKAVRSAIRKHAR